MNKFALDSSGLWVPTQKKLWQQIIKLASGAVPSLGYQDTTYYTPLEGKGFEPGSKKAMLWAARTYSFVGGIWRKEGFQRNILLTGNLTERVAERHRTRLAKALGPEIQKNISRYRDTPNYNWAKCASCDNWLATEQFCANSTYQGKCLRHLFGTVSTGWCPVYTTSQD